MIRFIRKHFSLRHASTARGEKEFLVTARFGRALILTMGCLLPLLCSAQVEKRRTWTNQDGVAIRAKLLRVEENPRIGKIVILELSGKETQVGVAQLSKGDQDYVRGYEKRQPVGVISDYAIEPSSEQRDFLSKHFMRSYLWRGKARREEISLPFQLHVPPRERRKNDRKLPLIVHLHGTGGFGTENLKPLFNDAGQIAKIYLEEKFQRYQPCYVMIPQGNVTGCWFTIDDDTPSRTLVAVLDALRLLLRDERFDIDPERIYLVGLSLGGAGVFEGVAKFPGFFAAGIPIAYVGYTERFSKELHNVSPLWVVINKNDLYYPKLRGFRRHYLEQGGEIRTSVYEQGGHDAWSKLLKNDGVRQWLFRQKLD